MEPVSRLGQDAFVSSTANSTLEIFRQDDAPKYYRAWRTTASVLAFGVVVGFSTNISYRMLNRRAAKKEQLEGVEVRRYHL